MKDSAKSLINLLEQNDKFAVAAFNQKLTLATAMDGTQISVIKNIEGANKIVHVISLMLEKVRISLMIPNNAEQQEALVECAIRIVNEYWFMKLEEISLCLYNARSGKYGKSYHKLNEEVVMIWLQKYDEERTSLIDQSHESAKHSTANPSDRSPEPLLAKGFIEQWVNQQSQKKIDAYKRKANCNPPNP